MQTQLKYSIYTFEFKKERKNTHTDRKLPRTKTKQKMINSYHTFQIEEKRIVKINHKRRLLRLRNCRKKKERKRNFSKRPQLLYQTSYLRE